LVKTPSTPIGVMKVWIFGVNLKGTGSLDPYKNVFGDKAKI